jgi:hypothetical protein
MSVVRFVDLWLGIFRRTTIIEWLCVTRIRVVAYVPDANQNCP